MHVVRDLLVQCDSLSPTVLNARIKELIAAKFIGKSAEGYVATPMGRQVYGQLVPLGKTARDWGRLLSESDPA